MMIVENPAADAYIDSNHYDLNYRGYIVGWIGKKNNSCIYRLLMKFDLSAIPKNAVIDSAKLKLYVNDVQKQSSTGYFTPYPILSSWDEYTVTWDTAPPFDKSGACPGVAIDNTGWYEWDITDYIISWHNGSMVNNGLIFTCDEQNNATAKRVISSKNRKSNNIYLRPVLIANYSLPVSDYIMNLIGRDDIRKDMEKEC